jgi:WD40 repeat protein
LSFNGKLLFIGDSLWDAESGKQLWHREVQPPVLQAFVTATRFSPDGRRFFSATANPGPDMIVGGPFELRDLAAVKETVRFVPQPGCVVDAQFSSDGKRILTAWTGNPDPIQIWDASSGRRLLVLQGLYTAGPDPSSARYVSFSPEGRRVLVLSMYKATIGDAITGEQLCSLELEPAQRTKEPDFFVSTQFSPDGKLFLTEQCNGVTRIWDAATGQQVQIFTAVHESEQSNPYALFTPDGRRVISGSDEGIAILWDLASGKEIRRFQTPGLERGPVDQMTISNDGKRLITSCQDVEYAGRGNRSSIRNGILWDVETGREIRQVTKQTTIYAERIVGFSPSDETFITVKGGKPAALWDGATGKMIREYNN